MNFKSWYQNVEATNTIQVNRNTVRDFYLTPNKVQIMVDTVIPYNWFKKTFERVVVCLSMKKTAENIAKVKHFCGEVSDDYYTDENHFTPLFNGDNGLENAYNFSQTLTTTP